MTIKVITFIFVVFGDRLSKINQGKYLTAYNCNTNLSVLRFYIHYVQYIFNFYNNTFLVIFLRVYPTAFCSTFLAPSKENIKILGHFC